MKLKLMEGKNNFVFYLFLPKWKNQCKFFSFYLISARKQNLHSEEEPKKKKIELKFLKRNCI